ncbi:MAG: hypothetical protein ACR2RV_19230 [Verrucomicrobiales bacterium]
MMKSSFSSILLAFCLAAISGCETLPQGNGGVDGNVPPAPITPPAADTGVVYRYLDDEWLQQRVTLTADDRVEKEDEDRWQLSFRAEVSVWRFNSATGEYDIPVSAGSPSAYLGLGFGYYGGDGDDDFTMTPGNSSDSGGSVGVSGDGFTEVTLSVEPQSGQSSATSIVDELELSVTAKMTIRPEEGAENMSGSVGGAEVSSDWVVKPMPGRQAAFIRRVEEPGLR